MDLTIYNENATVRTGCIDVYDSLIWVRRDQKNGSFQLTAPASQKNIEFLKKRRVIQKGDDKEFAYITDFNISKNADGIEKINCSGLFLSGWLYRNVVLENGANLGELIENNLGSVPIAISDEVYDVSFESTAENDDGDEIQLTDDFVGQNLGEVLEAVCQMHDLGFRVVMVNKIPTLQVYSGVNRSISQSDNPRRIFSDNFENLLSAEYSDSDVGAVNTVYCRCKIPSGCEPCPPLTYDIIPTDENEPRFEKYVEVEAITFNISHDVVYEEFNPDTNEMEVTDSFTVTLTYVSKAETLAKMKIEAQKMLSPIAENFEGTVDFKLKYRTEYDLGDIVTIKHAAWDKQADVRITEVTEYYDNVTNAVIPTFGQPKRTILEILKKG